MLKRYDTATLHQSGFSLVELMVGLVIGLIASLVIMQVFSAYEGQKRSTSGTADAQTNGSIALHHIQRDVQMAGYGLPMPSADEENASLKCDPSPEFDHDGDPATDDLDIFPLAIKDGEGPNGSDVVIARFSTKAMGAVPVKIGSDANKANLEGLKAENNIGCQKMGGTDYYNIALISQGTSCRMAVIEGVEGDKTIRLNTSGAPIVDGAKIACMGDWQDHRYAIEKDDAEKYQLTLNGDPIVSEVVSMQAQYGVSEPIVSGEAKNTVVSWVDATGDWATPTVAFRNRIKAVRIAVVARNDLLEKDAVTNQCTTAKGVVNNGPCAWYDLDVDPAPAIDLSEIDNWQWYRYKTYETIIPLRNIIWSRGVL
ncbi:PilW family protein [Methylotenera sp. L2L1]|uniref:PilW family protein n=1 Tax=Methylotenera sp. L2L1 TaxID=1502770 RepID=UPI000564659F|nr:PilW family protein [Methylotenera sp. L2L1]